MTPSTVRPAGRAFFRSFGGLAQMSAGRMLGVVSDSSAAPVPSIRVVLAELPPVLAAIVRDAVRGQGVQIVDEVRDRAELPDVVARRRAEVVIVPIEASGVAQQHHELLRRNPELKILTVAASPGSADLYELRLLGNNVGQRGVAAAIRAVMASRGSSESPPGISHPRSRS